MMFGAPSMHIAWMMFDLLEQMKHRAAIGLGFFFAANSFATYPDAEYSRRIAWPCLFHPQGTTVWPVDKNQFVFAF